MPDVRTEISLRTLETALRTLETALRTLETALRIASRYVDLREEIASRQFASRCGDFI